jgi:hypothetical protein
MAAERWSVLCTLQTVQKPSRCRRAKAPRVARQRGCPLADTAATQSATLFPCVSRPGPCRPPRALMGCLRDIVVAQHGETHVCGFAGPWAPRARPACPTRDHGVSRSTDVAVWSVGRFAKGPRPGDQSLPKPARHMELLSRLALLEVSHVPCMSLQRRWPPRQWGGQSSRPRLACPARLVARQLPSLQPLFSRVLRSTWRRRTAAMPHPGPMLPPPRRPPCRGPVGGLVGGGVPSLAPTSE